MKVPATLFGEHVWSKLIAQPLGSLTKRELELILLRGAVDSGFLDPRADSLAETCNIPITRAHGYLQDLALRQPAMTDTNGITALVGLLRDSEVVPDQSHFSIPLQDAALRIWLERRMVSLRLNAGDVLRRDHVKLTPVGLAKIMGAADGIVSPFEALKRLPPELRDIEWVKCAKQSWRKGMGWKEAMEVLGNAATIWQAVLPALFFLK